MNRTSNRRDVDSALVQAKWLLIVGVIVVIFSPYLLTANSFFGRVNFTNTGQIGDTIGGITAPFVNLLGAVLVFLALRAQIQANELVQDQVEEQRNQYYISRVTETIYLQLNRIDESIKSSSFTFDNPFKQEANGYDGLYLFNKTIKEEQIKFLHNPDDLHKNTHLLISNNISQLTDIYDKIAAAVVIIDNLLVDYNLSLFQNRDLNNLLILNLGESIRENVEQISEFAKWHAASSTDLDSVWVSETQISRLRQLVHIVHNFYTKLLQFRVG